ncbi:MAG: DapH/DapD/GlmU-related protein [Bacteroidota bacterium]
MINRLLDHISFHLVRRAKRHRQMVQRKHFGLPETVSLNDVYLDGNVSIGAHTYVHTHSRVAYGPNTSVRIGQYCSIGRNVSIVARTHSLHNPTANEHLAENERVEKDITIGHYCWIGDNVLIHPGISISDYAVIGANSVVTKDIKAFEIVGGVPARHIRFNTEHAAYSETHSS